MDRVDFLIKHLDMKFAVDKDGTPMYTGATELNKDFYIPHIDIICTSDMEWEKLTSELKNILRKRKEKTNG